MTSVAVQSETPNSANGVPALVTTSGGVTELLTKALDKGASVKDLIELVELHERMSNRQARQEFAHALAQFQSECPTIKKNKTAEITTNNGGQFSYTFADLPQVTRVVDPILAKHGFSYGWDSAVVGTNLSCTCTLRHIGGHSESSSFTLPTESKSGASAQQKFGAALTFAQRRTLSSVLGLTTTDEDTDGAEKASQKRISDDQAIVLNELIKEANISFGKFLKWADVDKVSDVRSIDFEGARAMLEQRRDEARARAKP